MRTALGILLCVAAITGCATTASMNTPDGFARFEDPEEYRVVTPEGIFLRVRVEQNRPEQSLEFWAEALAHHLSNSGYTLVEQSRFQAAAGSGTWFEWLAPVGQDDWIFLTAIVVAGEQIVVVESAGPYDHYQAYREAVRAELSSIVLERR